MVLIGQTLQAYKGLSTEYLLRFAHALGIELCEINPAGTSLDNVEKIIPIVGSMKMSFHLPIVGIEGYDFAMKSKQSEIDDVIRLINKYGDDLNLIIGVVHPPEGEGNINSLVENLEQLDLPLVVENVQKHSDEEFRAIYKELKERLGEQLKGWLFDVAHSYLRNGPDKFMEIIDTLPFEEIEEIHFSDCLEDKDSHYSFGAGVLPIDDILSEIKKRGYNKILVNEIDAHPTIWSVIDSYRQVAKVFKKPLYWKVSSRKLIMKPIIQRRLKKAGII